MIFEDLRRNKEEDWAHKKPDNVSLGIVEETKQWHIFKDAYLDKVAVDYWIETILLQEILIVDKFVRNLKNENYCCVILEYDSCSHTFLVKSLWLLASRNNCRLKSKGKNEETPIEKVRILKYQSYTLKDQDEHYHDLREEHPDFDKGFS